MADENAVIESKNRVWMVAFSAIISVFIIFICYIYFWIRPFGLVTDGMSVAGQYGDSFGVLNSLFSGFGFVVLISTLLYQQNQMRLQQDQIKLQSEKDDYDAEERRSLFNLEYFEEANVKAMGLLADNNNDRTTWVRAARLLAHASVLAEGVSINNHRRVMEFKSLEYRTFFRLLLEDKPAAFFYGVEHKGVSLREACARSTAPCVKNGIEITSDNLIMSESAIFEIVSAAKWPDVYIDPLKSKFADSKIDSSTALYPGLNDFLHYTRKWSSYAGEVKSIDANSLN